MAVYTEVPAELLAEHLARYDVGTLVSAKGIAEGVSNSNFLVETSGGRFVLTLYERRIETGDLPYFLALMEHLAARGLPVPRPVRDRSGNALTRIAGKAACLVTWLPGVSLSRPTVDQAAAAGAALARFHLAAADFEQTRANALGPGWWGPAATALAPLLDGLAPCLSSRLPALADRIVAAWPPASALPQGTIHADLFPDNVLMLGTQVSGLIDFYFACTDHLAYDLAVLHAAWCFAADGARPLEDHAAALLHAYEALRPLEPDERVALPVLKAGAALRFFLSRAQDLATSESGAIVALKDPLPFLRRLEHYARDL